MSRWIRNVILTAGVLVCGATAAQAVGFEDRMSHVLQSGQCPKNDAAVAILSQDPYCAHYPHLSKDACQEQWKAYWGLTLQYNDFLEQCRMQHWPEHKA